MQCCLCSPGDLGQQRVVELATDRGADLGDFARCRQPVEACQQRVLQCRRHGERRQRQSSGRTCSITTTCSLVPAAS